MRAVAIAAFAALAAWAAAGDLLIALDAYPQPPWCWLVGITSFADGGHAFWASHRAAVALAAAAAIWLR
jgi:hypothetical protein